MVRLKSAKAQFQNIWESPWPMAAKRPIGWFVKAKMNGEMRGKTELQRSDLEDRITALSRRSGSQIR